MITPPLNSVCRYTFVSRFAALNGIYILQRIVTFAMAQAEETDFIATLYTPAGLTQEDYDEDWQDYLSTNVYRLVSVLDETVVLNVPTSIIDLVPDQTVVGYHKLSVQIYLGPVRNPADITWIAGELKDAASSLTGTQSDVTFFSHGRQWMTSQDATEYDAEVAASVSAVEAKTQTIRELRAENDRLQALVDTYESHIKTMSEPP